MLDKIKVSSRIGLVIFVLTLAVWVFFDRLDMRLDLVGTTVVATALALIFIFAQWLWSRRPHKGAK